MFTSVNQTNSELTFKYTSFATSTRKVIIAGLIGGLCEVFWVVAYSVFSSLSVSNVGREITHSVFPNLVTVSYAPILGVVIHFSLSILLVLGFMTCLWPILKNQSKPVLFASSLLVLVVIWAFNFFVLLPVVNPTFVTLMPYTVTLMSKLLFGFGLAMYLHKSCEA